MPNKNFDGIIKTKSSLPKKPTANVRPKVLRVDEIIVSKVYRKTFTPRVTLAVKISAPYRTKKIDARSSYFIRNKIYTLAIVVILLVGFTAGVWTTLDITRSKADSEPQVLGASTSVPSNYIIPLESNGVLGPVSSVPNEVLFNLSLDQLENYMAEKNSGAKQAEILALRKIKLKAYLEEKGSPLSQIVDTLAELKHWKLVLAISNSESSLGKRCYTNNCSGIGVEPGHPLWRSYKSKADWAKDLDKLLEKRYKDWTLEKMNGVYNQPGSKNWLMASKQILEDLQEQGIE